MNFRRVLWAAVFAASVFSAASLDAFILNQRWTRTATDGIGIFQGDPTTLTWSFVADGTTIPNRGGSDLIANFDTALAHGPGGSDLTQRPWFGYFADAFDRYSQLSGLTYAYEPNDDGSNLGSQLGLLGTRGDVRIGGAFIDGPNEVLAFNFFPNNGDMTMDTGDMALFSNASNDFRALRNVIMHEHGHGTGFAHVESSVRLLMEPFLQTQRFGPQMDDIRGIHRGYGDVHEKSNAGAGNDVAANATSLGSVSSGSPLEIGTDGRGNVRVLEGEVDFVSIDDVDDIDFFSINVNSPLTADLTVTPLGTTYNIGPQNGTQSPFDASMVSDLTVALFDTNQTTMLALDNSGGLGESDSISYSFTTPGEYYVRVTGAATAIQMYDLVVQGATGTAGDFDSNGVFECADVDQLVVEIAAGSSDLTYDMNADGVINTGDLDEWLSVAGAANLPSGNSYLLGDADLDGNVDGNDFLIWNNAKFTSVAAWCAGDFDASGFVDGNDFLAWNNNKFQSADALAVPEPGSVCLLLWACCLGRALTRLKP